MRSRPREVGLGTKSGQKGIGEEPWATDLIYEVETPVRGGVHSAVGYEFRSDSPWRGKCGCSNIFLDGPDLLSRLPTIELSVNRTY